MKTKKKALMLAMTMAAMLLTTGLNAQIRNDGIQERRGGLFGVNRSGGNQENLSSNFTLGGLTQENPTATAPLGSGLLILTATGAGYALLKKKEEKK